MFFGAIRRSLFSILGLLGTLVGIQSFMSIFFFGVQLAPLPEAILALYRRAVDHLFYALTEWWGLDIPAVVQDWIIIYLVIGFAYTRGFVARGILWITDELRTVGDYEEKIAKGGIDEKHYKTERPRSQKFVSLLFLPAIWPFPFFIDFLRLQQLKFHQEELRIKIRESKHEYYEKVWGFDLANSEWARKVYTEGLLTVIVSIISLPVATDIYVVLFSS